MAAMTEDDDDNDDDDEVVEEGKKEEVIQNESNVLRNEIISNSQLNSHPAPTPRKKVNYSVVGPLAPIDLTGTTPLGWASRTAKGRPSSQLRDLLFSPGDPTILPQKKYQERSGKTPIRKSRINRITQHDSNLSYIVYAHSDAQGWRLEMEDRVLACSPLLNTISNDSYWLFGVCDGHGGDFSSDFIVKSLPNILISNIQYLYQMQSQSQSYNINDIINCLYLACLKVDEKLSEEERMKVSAKQTGTRDNLKTTLNIGDSSGSTACICLFNTEDLLIANIGDSRAVLAQQSPLNPSLIETIPLSIDQKLSLPEERNRAIQSGYM